MFTVEQMKAAHAKVKTGADFPAYVQEIKGLGLVYYEFWVKDGSLVYHGDHGYSVSREGSYALQRIAASGSSEKLRYTILIHQQGQTDFLTFCRQAAEAGVEKWVVDTEKMFCTYYDLAGNPLVEEPIPLGY